MGRALSKPHLRVLAIDDGPFTRRHRFATVVVVAMTIPGPLDGVLATRVEVDGQAATDRIVELLEACPYLAGARAILIDGISVAGFNVLDLERLGRKLRRPVITVTRRAPDLRAMREAIRRYFPTDARRRWGLVRRQRLVAAPVGGNRRWVSFVGATRSEATEVLRRTTIVGAWPEPLRIAHLVAQALSGSRRQPVSLSAGAPVTRRAGL